jgi:hypothetical protein
MLPHDEFNTELCRIAQNEININRVPVPVARRIRNRIRKYFRVVILCVTKNRQPKTSQH